MNKVARINEADASPMDTIQPKASWKTRSRELVRVGLLVLLGVAVLIGLGIYLMSQWLPSVTDYRFWLKISATTLEP